MAEQQRDVIEVLEHDHREVEEMFAGLESLRGAGGGDAGSRRRDLMDQVTIENAAIAPTMMMRVFSFSPPSLARLDDSDEAQAARFRSTP